MMEQTDAEAKQLRACVNDLIAIVALPAIWSGSAPTEIARTLVDMLAGMLGLDFVYLRLKHSAEEPPVELVRSPGSNALTGVPPEIGELLTSWSDAHPREWPRLVRHVLADGELSIIPLPLGLEGEIGILLAGSQRADFPMQTERLILNVAANQATVWLQGARLLSEQKRVAVELDQKVAQRTEELATANRELRREIAKEQLISLENAQLYRDLEDRERRIHRLVDANILGIFMWNIEGAIVEANDAFLHMLQYGPEDIAMGRVRWTDLTPPEFRERDERALAELKATGLVQPYEKEYFRKDGDRVPVLVAGALFEEGGGEGVAFALDLSEPKRTEEALRRSETYLAEAQRVMRTGSCALDGKSRQILYWSDEMFRLFGFDPGRGLPMWDQWMERIHPDDRDKFRMAGDRTFLDKVHCDVEFRIVTPEGRVKHIHGISHPFLSPVGELVQVVGTMVDVTERRQEEEERDRLRQAQRVVVETANDAVVTADETGTIQFANPATTRVFGYDPDELIGKPLTVLMPEFLRTLHENGFRRYLATGQRHMNWQGTELTGLRKDRHEFPAEVSFGEMTTNGHRVFTGFIRDITERKRAEQERERLRQAQADLAHINRVSTMGELTAALTHEVKQPIAAAVTNAKTCLRWLRREQPDLMEASDAASRLIKDVTRASDIISRIGSLFKKGLPRPEMVNVNEIIREMIALLRSEAARHAISIDDDLASNVPQIMVDRVQLQQVLMNLMLNGIEAMTELSTPGRLTITSRHEENGQLLISVVDVGTGIKPEQAEHIFDAFVTSKPQGTGMGLAISRSIIESHGGRLWATANSGPGTTFQFTLPIEVTASEVA